MNISEDLLQINSTFGYKAARRWYYSLNLQFKTQLFNSYPSNSDKLKSAFLSPGELNLGLGMTYNYQNDKKTFDFNATIAPLRGSSLPASRKESTKNHTVYVRDAMPVANTVQTPNTSSAGR